MIWIILALIVAFLKSLWELAGKIFTSEKNISSLDEYALSLGTRILSFIILLPIALYTGIPAISMNMWGILWVSSVLWAIATVTALKAVKHWDLSLVSPLSALTIPFLLATSYLITKEVPNSYGYLGVSLIFIWTYFLQIHEAKQGILWPLKAIYDNLWARYMLLTALLWSITSPLDKIGVVELWALQWMFISNIGIIIVLGVYMILKWKSFSFHEITHVKALKKIWVLTILGWFAMFLQMLALQFTLVIYVIALKRASGMFSVFLWYIFFKEKNIIQKLFASLIMLAWVTIIGIFGNI